jgi:hypothetical protein
MRKHFEKEWISNGLNRRQPENHLQRIAKESEQQDEGRIARWLDLAKEMFDGDDDPTPDAA